MFENSQNQNLKTLLSNTLVVLIIIFVCKANFNFSNEVYQNYPGTSVADPTGRPSAVNFKELS